MGTENKKITTKIKAKNIAPIKDLSKEISSSSIKFGIFANNGSGKTYLSRLFRLAEQNEVLFVDEKGISPTDKIISLGENKSEFSFEVIDKSGTKIEELKIELQRGQLPKINSLHYLFHTFNQDYVEDNIKALGYNADSDVEGFILGKSNIDLKDDEDKLKKIEEDGIKLKDQIDREVIEYVDEKIKEIKDIRRLNEYKELTTENIIKSINKKLHEGVKTVDELIEDYNKIKAVPENLNDIPFIPKLKLDLVEIDDIKERLIKEYTLSSLAQDFKEKIKSKQLFVEKGMELIKDETCPFCEQKLEDDALKLIDDYSKYIEDVESKTIKAFRKYIVAFEEIIKSTSKIELQNSKNINLFNEYKTKYIPSCEDLSLSNVDSSNLSKSIEVIKDLIEEKSKNISVSLPIEESLFTELEKNLTILNNSIESNNELIEVINSKKGKLNIENKQVRKDICKSAFNHLVSYHKGQVTALDKIREDYKALNTEITKKREQQKVSKRKKVASTIKSVLNYFFSEKYSLDEETFRLTFQNKSLAKEQAKDILSEGEKNIVAFAYYLGDTHVKVNSEEDYKKILFIIDDPISSMDFTHVYTLSGVIRDISSILEKIDKDKFIIFTHNNDFMRVLTTNKIIVNKYLLKNGQLKKFNNNLTVPYINHLSDVYAVAREDETPTHTTANSIRHIIETLTKFENVDLSKDGVSNYIKEKVSKDTKTYTMINDLSHGGWRTEQPPIDDDDFKNVCEVVIKHIESKYLGQVEYCKKMNKA